MVCRLREVLRIEVRVLEDIGEVRLGRDGRLAVVVLDVGGVDEELVGALSGELLVEEFALRVVALEEDTVLRVVATRDLAREGVLAARVTPAQGEQLVERIGHACVADLRRALAELPLAALLGVGDDLLILQVAVLEVSLGGEVVEALLAVKVADLQADDDLGDVEVRAGGDR